MPDRSSFVQFGIICTNCTNVTNCKVLYILYKTLNFVHFEVFAGCVGLAKPVVLPFVSRTEGPVFVVRKQLFGFGMEDEAPAMCDIARTEEGDEFS